MKAEVDVSQLIAGHGARLDMEAVPMLNHISKIAVVLVGL
jgi:hypothetical protein